MTVTLGPDFGPLDIDFKQGEKVVIEIVCCDSNRVALDYSTGYTAAMQVRETLLPGSPLVIDLTDSITLQAGTNDDADPDNCVPNVVITIEDEVTAELVARNSVHDLFIEQTASDDNRCWIAGKFKVRQAVTHG